MDGPTLGVMKKFKEYRTKTEQFMQEMENTLTDFEKNKDPQKLYERTRDAIKRFSDI
ncbi:MAG: hypothetical protein KGI25_08815 [Thaumarchaeota archaeon]|nr:hypothetical protein [Nitrososphaerota archaeon]